MPPPPCEANKISSQFKQSTVKERHTHTAEKCECECDIDEEREWRNEKGGKYDERRCQVIDI